MKIGEVANITGVSVQTVRLRRKRRVSPAKDVKANLREGYGENVMKRHLPRVAVLILLWIVTPGVTLAQM